MADHDSRPPTDHEVGRALSALAGATPPPLDLETIRSRAARRRNRRRAGVVGLAAVAVTGLALGPSVVADIGADDEGQTVVVSPGPDGPEGDGHVDPAEEEVRHADELRRREQQRQRAEEARRLAELQRAIAEINAGAARCLAATAEVAPPTAADLANAVATVEEVLAARMSGGDVGRCTAPEVPTLLDAPGVDLLTNMRSHRFDSPYSAEEDERRATRPIPTCLHFADCDDPVVEYAVVDARRLGGTVEVADVDVRYTTENGRETGQTYRVSWAREAGETDLVRQLVVSDVRTDLLAFGGAERVVIDYMSALAAGRYDQAAFWFQGAAEAMPILNGHSGDGALDALVAAEPALAAAGDVEGILKAFCETHGGPCAPVLEVTATAGSGTFAHVVVTLDDGTGRPVERDGRTTFAVEVDVFEGLIGTGSVPAPFH